MKLPHVLIVILIAVSAFFCADMTAALIEAQLNTLPSLHVRDFKPQLGKGEAGRAFADYSIIPRRNLFGLKTPKPQVAVPKVKTRPAAKKVAAIPRAKKVKQTLPKPQLKALKLKLKGTISGSSAWARAIVEDLNKSEEVLLKIGEKIQSAELVEIKLGEIILLRQGVRLTLKIGEDQKPKAVSSKVKPKPPKKRKQKRMELGKLEEIPAVDRLGHGGSILEKEGLGNKIDDWNWELDRQAIVNRINNLGDLINQVSVVPNYVDGAIRGFRVSNITPDSLFQILGAQEGDIVEEVNGIPLNNMNQVMSLYSELQVAPELRVRVKRGQSYQFLVYNLQ